MAAYNAAGTIEQAIASALGQTHANVELIVVNDGSTDDTSAVLGAIDHPAVRVIHQDNAGPSAARNRAAKEATGDYVACIDADDFWHPHKLETQLRVGESADATVVYGWTNIVDPIGGPLGKDWRVRHNGDVYHLLLQRNFIWGGSNSMIRRDAFEAVGGFDESLRAAEDWDLHLRLAETGKFANAAEVLVDYRVDPASQSGDLQLMEDSYLAVTQKHYARHPELSMWRSRSDAAFYSHLAGRAIRAGINLPKLYQSAAYLRRAINGDLRNLLPIVGLASPSNIWRSISRKNR